MPSSSADLKRRFGELLKEAFYASMERGYLGEPIGGGQFKFHSDTKKGRHRVRLMKNDLVYAVVDAINFNVPLDPRIRILVDKNADGEYEVFGPDPRWVVENLDRLPGVGVGPHSHRLGFGLVDMVESARFEPGLVVWHSASLFVRVLAFSHRHNGVDQFIPETSVNVASAVPTTAGTWTWAKVCYAPATLDFMVIAGPEEPSKGALTEASLVAIPAPNVVPLGGVKLKAGQTQIVDGADFLDCRPFFGGGDGGEIATGEPVTYCGQPVWFNGEQVFYEG